LKRWIIIALLSLGLAGTVATQVACDPEDPGCPNGATGTLCEPRIRLQQLLFAQVFACFR
jgi:hypothetical protein